MRKVKAFFAFLMVLLVLYGCNAQADVIEEEIFALDTVINFTIYSDDKEAVSMAKAEVRRLEALLSVTDSNSDISKINSSADTFTQVSDECFSLISTALDVSEKTDGNFDITIYPAAKLWGFTTSDKYVPADYQLEEIKTLIDYRQINLYNTTKGVKIPEGVSLDLGGIAKGYISDKTAILLKEQGITSAILNLGGNIRLIGRKPNGENFKIGVKSPFGSGYFGIVEANDTNISTAGGYERYFEENGKRYHHILDPFTASPADTDVLSATVIGENGEVCDALSTSAVIMGSEKINILSDRYPDYSLIILTKNYVYVSDAIADSFELTENFKDYEIIVI